MATLGDGLVPTGLPRMKVFLMPDAVPAAHPVTSEAEAFRCLLASWYLARLLPAPSPVAVLQSAARLAASADLHSAERIFRTVISEPESPKGIQTWSVGCARVVGCSGIWWRCGGGLVSNVLL